MEHIFFLNPVFNDGKLYCFDNVVFILFLLIFLCGVGLCWCGQRRWPFWTGTILSNITGFAANWLSSLVVPGYEDILRYLVFFTLFWLFATADHWLIKRISARLERHPASPEATRLGTVIAGTAVMLLSGYWLFWHTLFVLFFALLCFVGGLIYQNYCATHPVSAATWPQLEKRAHDTAKD